MQITVDLIISKLTKKNEKNFIFLTEEEIVFLCFNCKKVLLKQDILLELKAPIKIWINKESIKKKINNSDNCFLLFITSVVLYFR